MNTLIRDSLKEMRDDIKTELVVMYHENCMDGNGVLLAVAENFKKHKIIPMPVTYGKTSIKGISKLVAEKNVIMGDFSLDTNDMLVIKNVAKDFVALDHHQTAIARFKALNFAEVDIRESGATLVWKYLTCEPIPPLLEYIKDRDLWEHKLDNTREVNAGANKIGRDEPLLLLPYMHDVDELKSIGEPIIAEIDAKVDKVIRNNNMRLFSANNEYGVYIKNRDEISLVGSKLSKGNPYIAQIFLTDDKLVISLRSDKDSKTATDVSKICASYGGGGHKNAAAMSFAYEDIDISTLFKTGDLDKALANTFIKSFIGDLLKSVI